MNGDLHRTIMTRHEPASRTLAPLAHEKRLAANLRWALSESSRFFNETGAVHEALRKVTARLDELGIPYAVAGAMSLFAHGVRRFTEDVDILVTREGLKLIHQKLNGLGYVPKFVGAKNLRDADNGVAIEFLVSGTFPGDGRPKPVAFPEPSAVAIERDGVRYLNLPTLVTLKLASGMTDPNRMKDLADVQEITKVLGLPLEFQAELDPFVRTKYEEIWKSTRAKPKRYVRLWRNKLLTLDAESLGDMIERLRSATEELAMMKADGVMLDPEGGTRDDYAYLVTTDPDIARKYEMHDEAELWGGEDLDEEPGGGE